MAAGVDDSAHIDDVQNTLLECTSDVAVVIPHLQEQLENKGTMVYVTNRRHMLAGSRACRGGTRFGRWSRLICRKNE